MKLKQSTGTAVVLANASELVLHIGQAVIGNEVADTFDGSPITRATIYNLAQTEFQASLAKTLGE
jgi:hypothetical protein